MKKHKHKESFSILLISNTDRSSRQFNISLFAVRIILTLLFFLILVAVWMTCQFSFAQKARKELRTQLTARDTQIGELESEKENLNNEINTLNNEIKALKAQIDDLHAISKTIAAQKETEPEPEADTSFPSLSPSSDMSMLVAAYSEEQPYLSINTHIGVNIIATGDGTIAAAAADDTYPLIIEIDHGNGYKTRYMCRQTAQMQPEAGAQIKAGDILCTITTDNTQVDYQVLLDGNPIDPLNVIDAKG